jgi:hypothetical protein
VNCIFGFEGVVFSFQGTSALLFSEGIVQIIYSWYNVEGKILETKREIISYIMAELLKFKFYNPF